MIALRPSDLAREHGISTQAVRNYERQGVLPYAERSDSGYRRYTPLHATALRTFLALIPAYGHADARSIMNAVHRGDLEAALRCVHRCHHQALRDQETLDSVKQAIVLLSTTSDLVDHSTQQRPHSIGELARHLDLTSATLRAWETAGILRPGRDPATGFRRYLADDLRDAELTHLLRRGGYPLHHIATVVDRIRTAGGTQALAESLADWSDRLTSRGLAMLTAASMLDRYLGMLQRNDSAHHADDGGVQHVGQKAHQQRQQT